MTCHALSLADCRGRGIAEGFEVSARTVRPDGSTIIMGLRHREVSGRGRAVSSGERVDIERQATDQEFSGAINFAGLAGMDADSSRGRSNRADGAGTAAHWAHLRARS